MLQRFRELTGALLLGFEQPRVLDGDHCLVGEGGYQLDLLFGEWVHFIAGEREDADCRSVTQEGHAKASSVSGGLLIAGRAVFGIGQHVRNMNCLAF